jgi:hypothetical protein
MLPLEEGSIKRKEGKTGQGAEIRNKQGRRYTSKTGLVVYCGGVERKKEKKRCFIGSGQVSYRVLPGD